MMSPAWFVGIDLGTGSCKAAAVDEDGQVLGFGAGEYSGAEAQERWQEQDPQELFRAAIASVRQAVERSGARPERCGGMSIGGALHSVMALDDRDQPLTGVITWADGRAVKQAEAVAATEAGKRLYPETGCPPHGMYPLYKVMWLRENRPEVFQKARRYVSAKEYAGFRLTGTWQVDYSLAAGSGFLNTHTLEWSDSALNQAGIRPDQLSPLAAPVDLLGRLSAEVAAQMGIPAGTPVVTGSSDAVNSSIGAGAVAPTQATLMIGTSGALRMVASRPVLDAKARSWCYAIDGAHWLVGGAINNGGVALSWLRDCLNQAHVRQPLTFEDVLALAGRAPVGSGGLVCLPFFAGERSPNWNLNARAVFFGMSLTHEARHLARALLEGMAFRFKSLLAVLTEVGLDVKQIVASGGFTQSDLWLQVMADALGRELSVPKWGETSALAAAFWPFLSMGGAASISEIRNWVQSSRVQQPVPEHAALYDRIYPLYTELYRSLTGAFDEAARLQHELGW
ncbi:MAG: gluconokinase [Desulfobacterales bacterium]|jgi:gluconokinase|nr:gluconokinase [Desulfobacterales bacterium]